ncbi:MAG: hypothetical protein CMO66_05090 [Verrucomicrobiales bacterium]|nr:hypothetical protein [Verrucomicrobiales bacterium]
MKTNLKAKLTLWTAALSLTVPGVRAQEEVDERIQALEQRILAMQQELQAIRGDAGDDIFNGAHLTKKSGMNLHFYGEAKYNWTKGSNGNYFDPHRFVMMPSYKINDWIFFNSELEVEHGGVDDSDDSRWRGAVELEQMYADVKVNDWLNWRSIGVSLIPVGTINLYHEPDLFYSVHRPIMYKYIIPSTWMEGSTGFFGDVPNVEGLSYMFLVSQGLSSADAKIDDSKGTRNARPNLYAKGDNRQLAYSFRLAYDGSGAESEWLKGFAGSVSTYIGNYQENTTSDTSAILWDVEASYRFQSGTLKNFELIADYAQWHFGNPSAIADVNVGENQYGYRLEAAYHHGFGAGQELVPFFRYEGYDLSDDGVGKAGFVESGSKNYLTYGAAWFLDPAFVIKAAVRQSLDVASSSEFSLGVGYHF